MESKIILEYFITCYIVIHLWTLIFIFKSVVKNHCQHIHVFNKKNFRIFCTIVNLLSTSLKVDYVRYSLILNLWKLGQELLMCLQNRIKGKPRFLKFVPNQFDRLVKAMKPICSYPFITEWLLIPISTRSHCPINFNWHGAVS